jgi:hypothetical protein
MKEGRVVRKFIVHVLGTVAAYWCLLGIAIYVTRPDAPGRLAYHH